MISQNTTRISLLVCLQRLGSACTIVLLSTLFVFLPGCKRSGTFRISGSVSGAEGKVLYLEHQGLTQIQLLDSLVLKEEGTFSFTQPVPEYPDFYRLRLEKQTIPFPIDSAVHLKVTADAASFATSYTIEGSRSARNVKDIWLAQLDANVQASKSLQQYNKGQITAEQTEAQVDSILVKYKEQALRYIYASPASPEAYFALFQQINGMLIFNIYDRQDSRAFSAVANSYEMYYPESARTKHLYDLAVKSVAVVRAQRNAAQAASDTLSSTRALPLHASTVGYIDIDLPDMNGKGRTLSEVVSEGPTLLCFTAMGEEWSSYLVNRLREMYEAYHPKGLQIYMVSLDAETHIWKSATEKLPWVNVRDKDGAYSQLVGYYNLQTLPTLFLLNRNKEIVHRFSSLDEMPEWITRVL